MTKAQDGTITPEKVLSAYQHGMFPMARGLDGEIHWYISEPRAIIPLDSRFKVRRSLQKFYRKGEYQVSFDTCFEDVIRGCARHSSVSSEEVWLSDEMIEIYIDLFNRGYGHSVEVKKDGELIGGLYGVAMRSVFFGESMFSRKPYASQVALLALVERLRQQDYQLLDAQVRTPHLEQFGLLEVTHEEYLKLLLQALREPRSFFPASA